MARRHTAGFDVVGMTEDPTPGDPEAIRSHVVVDYRKVADETDEAVTILGGTAVEEGTGEAMDALRDAIEDDFLDKLRTVVTTYHEAADAFEAYAGTLEEAQGDLDKAMDQAGPVAATAGTDVPDLGPDPTPEERSEHDQKQGDVDAARDKLNGAKALAADAKALRDKGAATLVDALENVTTVPDRSFFEKFLDWFKSNPLLQILVGIFVAIVSVFFPVVGFLLGAATFALFTTFSTLANGGKLDVGGLVIGILTLGFGGVMTGIRAGLPVLKGIGEAFKAGVGKVGGMLGKLPGGIGAGIKATGDVIKSRPWALTGIKGFTEAFVPGTVINFIGAGINKGRDGTAINPAVILAGAAAGGVVGGAGGAAVKGFVPAGTKIPLPKFGSGPTKPAPTPPPATGTRGPTGAPPPPTRPAPPPPSQQPAAPPAPTRPPPPPPSQQPAPPPAPTRPPPPPPSQQPAAPPAPTRPPPPPPAQQPAASTTPPATPGTPGGIDATKAGNTAVGVGGAFADGGTKVGVTDATDPDADTGETASGEGTGGQAGIGAGSLANVDPPATGGKK
jgi:hypothetical protein